MFLTALRRRSWKSRPFQSSGLAQCVPAAPEVKNGCPAVPAEYEMIRLLVEHAGGQEHKNLAGHLHQSRLTALCCTTPQADCLTCEINLIDAHLKQFGFAKPKRIGHCQQ